MVTLFGSELPKVDDNGNQDDTTTREGEDYSRLGVVNGIHESSRLVVKWLRRFLRISVSFI